MERTDWPDHYSTSDIEQIGWIVNWLESSGGTRTSLARSAGISVGTVSQVLAGKYVSPPSAHIEAMGGAIGRDADRRAEPSDIPWVQTSIARDVHAVAQRTHRDRDIGLYAGRVGLGKTMALQRYAADNPRSAVFLEAYPGAGAPVLLRLLAERLGAPVRRRTVADLTATCVEALSGGDRVLLVDEAETLTDSSLLHLRRISDSAGVGVVLAGTPALVGLVSDRDGKFGQIASRIGFWPPIATSIAESDVRLLAQSFLGRSPDEAVLAALWTACQGSARALRNVMRNSTRWCRRNGASLDATVIERIDRQTMAGARLAA